MTASVFDVAKYIAEKTGELSAMKLQKLAYYSQAWHLVWEEEPLFPQDFQAWANGPVVPELYARHRGMLKVDVGLFHEANTDALDATAKENIDKVLSFYGTKSAFELSHMTHQEKPWLDARGETPVGEYSCVVITQAAMAEYYSSL